MRSRRSLHREKLCMHDGMRDELYRHLKWGWSNSDGSGRRRDEERPGDMQRVLLHNLMHASSSMRLDRPHCPYIDDAPSKPFNVSPSEVQHSVGMLCVTRREVSAPHEKCA